ncbi:MAG: ThiF family adenylyltransferase [Planctomycetota bacterium]
MSTRRFERQERFAPLGAAGQARLLDAHVLIVGCGALGGFMAQLLTRAGVGTLVLVDRDIVEESNLPRQVLFHEAHARAGAAKVEAAAETLAAIGGPTRLETHARHLDADLLPRVAAGCTLMLDGTDNLPTRYLLNDWSVREGVPWVYGGVVASGGVVMPILPGHGPCLRCLFREPPPPGTLATCDTAGVLGPAVGAVASLQAGLALRLLADGPARAAGAGAGEDPARGRRLTPSLVELDVWSGETRRIEVDRDPECPCCGARDFPWLERPTATEAVALCGRDTVEVRPRGGRPDLARVAERLRGIGVDAQRIGPMLRFRTEAERVTLFPDGRALVEGTEDLGRALAVIDRWVGA